MFYTNLLASVFTYVVSQKISKVFIFISGFHSKRFSFLKDFFSRIRPVKILRVFYVSGKAFNGCRKKKMRRL
jgi:ribosomal protein S11